MSARAIWFTGPRSATLLDEDVPAPGPREVQVRARTGLVSAGTEMVLYRGETRSRAETALPTSAGEYPFPIKYGYQTVGEVLAAGEGAELAVGQRVFAYHPHQTVFNILSGPFPPTELAPYGRRLLFAVPDGVGDEHAVFANLFSVALTTMLDVPVRHGDVVAVAGLGVVGSFVAHLARATAGRLILVDPLASRRSQAGWIGADAVVEPAVAGEAIAGCSNGRGADIYVEASGSPAALQGAIEGTGREGTVAVVSYFGGKTVPLVLAPEFHFRRLRLVSVQNAMVGSGLQPRWDTDRRMALAMERLASLDTARLISHRFAFGDAPAAYELLDRRPDEALGVLLQYGGG